MQLKRSKKKRKKLGIIENLILLLSIFAAAAAAAAAIGHFFISPLREIQVLETHYTTSNRSNYH